MDSIIAVTVTYNRVNTLKRTINSLVKQTSANLCKIIVVDNASNEENKKELLKLQQIDNRIEIIYLDENLGGAGGFYSGMKYAREKYDPDGYWVMDDDAYPRPDCLDNMLKDIVGLDNIGFICPVIYGIDNNKYQTYHHKHISKLKVKEILNIKDISKLESITQIEANAFVGPLFLKNVVDKVGFPDKDLFIYGDDTEYTYRIFFNGFKGFLIKDAIIEHQDPPKQQNKLSPTAWWKDYYMFRNKFFFVKKFSKNFIFKIIGLLILNFNLFKKIIATLIKPSYRGYKRVRLNILIKAITDGMFNKTGKTIDPSEYNKMLQSMK